jgi:hypothetical protein
MRIDGSFARRGAAGQSRDKRFLVLTRHRGFMLSMATGSVGTDHLLPPGDFQPANDSGRCLRLIGNSTQARYTPGPHTA